MNAPRKDNLRPLSIADYSPTHRPAKIVDLMHEVVSRYTDDRIAFYPLLDAILLLLSKPIALSFHTAENGSSASEPFFSTYAEYGETNLFDPMAVEGRSLVALPAKASASDSAEHLVSLADILEIVDPSTSRKGLKVVPHTVAADSVDPRRAPDGLVGHKLDLWLLSRLFLELRDTATDDCEPSSRVLAVLRRGLQDRRVGGRKAGSEGPRPWSSADVAAWDAMRREVLEDYWRPILDEALPQSPEFPEQEMAATVSSALRFMCVFRFALPGDSKRFDNYDYSALLGLSRYQRKIVVDWLNDTPQFRSTGNGDQSDKAAIMRESFDNIGENVAEALELPLGAHYRSISDTHFGSGFIDFAAESEYPQPGGARTGKANATSTDSGGEEAAEDNLRKKAETLVLDQRGSHVFYVPIHVAGIPWLGLLILENRSDSPDVDDRAWRERYHLYRGEITTLGQQLRQSSQKAYSSALSRALLRELQAGGAEDVVYAVNVRWAKLSAFFPFDLVMLEPAAATTPGAIRLPGGEILSLSVHDNPHGCFSSGRLEFDHFQVSVLQRDLQTVLEIFEAERLRGLSLQESAWAHDVKHWTAPILSDLFSALNELSDTSPAKECVHRALLHSRILNATAQARQMTINQQQFLQYGRANGEVLGSIFDDFSPGEVEKLLTLVLELLLAAHAENPATRERSDLVWQGKRASADTLMELDKFLGGTGWQSDLTSASEVVGRRAVIWSLSLLREIVQNIKINNPIQELNDEGRRIQINYRIETITGNVVIIIEQEQYERKRRQIAFPPGLRKTNLLYGPRGARVGWVDENPKLDQHCHEIDLSCGGSITAMRIKYVLKVHFFVNGDSHVS